MLNGERTTGRGGIGRGTGRVRAPAGGDLCRISIPARIITFRMSVGRFLTEEYACMVEE